MHCSVATGYQEKRELTGIDVFVYMRENNVEKLADILQSACVEPLSLTMISSRGLKVWPEGSPESCCSDHWRCRFKGENGALTNKELITLLTRIDEAGIDVIKTENLYNFDGKPGYSMGQGE